MVQTATARAVVFCGGGFQNSEELVRRYISPWPEEMVVRSNRSSDGVALRNLLPLGASVTHGMHSFYGHTLPYIPGKTWESGLEFLAGSLYFSDYCLIVNQLGLRFTDESVGCIDEHNAERGCQQPYGRYFVIFDERIRRERIDVDLMGIPGIEATRVPAKLDQLRELGASIVSAATPDELAAAMEAEFGVPAANAADTLRTFNATTDPIGELDPPAAATTPRSRRPRCARSPASRASPTPWAAWPSRPTCACSTASTPPAPTRATSSRTSTAAGSAGPPSPAVAPAAPPSPTRSATCRGHRLVLNSKHRGGEWRAGGAWARIGPSAARVVRLRARVGRVQRSTGPVIRDRCWLLAAAALWGCPSQSSMWLNKGGHSTRVRQLERADRPAAKPLFPRGIQPTRLQLSDGLVSAVWTDVSEARS